MFASVADSPFAALTLIAAPAVFTNASSVLALGTGNRLARVVDRTRVLARDLHSAEVDVATREMWRNQVSALERRAAFLVRAMSFFYTAIGAFAAASLVSVLGASLAAYDYKLSFEATAAISFVAGTVGFVCLVLGCSLLVRETRVALRSLSEEARLIKSWFK